MEKKGDPTSVSVMTYDDTQSTYTLEAPPPAYRKPDHPSVKIARLVAATVLLVSVVIGAVVLGSIYIQTKNQCAVAVQQPQQQQQTGDVLVDNIQAESMPMAEALHQGAQIIELSPEIDSREDNSPTPSSSDDSIHIPLQLDMDEITGQMMENNHRARVNCLIEKKKAEEVITQSPKQLRTPFGNLTTDHRYVHVTGETMSLSCRSGNEHLLRPFLISDEDERPPQPPMHFPSQPQMPPQMQQQQQPMMAMQSQQAQRRPMMGNGPMMLGPNGPMPPPPPHMMMDPNGMREPRNDHFRAKRSATRCDCSCKCPENRVNMA